MMPASINKMFSGLSEIFLFFGKANVKVPALPDLIFKQLTSLSRFYYVVPKEHIKEFYRSRDISNLVLCVPKLL